MTKLPVGEQELRILKDLVEHGPGSVGELHVRYGEPLGLARSTVLTMMERLRKKGQLVRRLDQGVYRYRARATSAELMQGVVQRFVERNLGGSVSPFLAYLSDANELSDDELSELTDLVSRLKTSRKKAR